jgi:hypothetical protein
MSSIAVFLVLGGATAFAASNLAKNSVGTKQLKSNAVTKAKIKKNAVTEAKIKSGAVTNAKLGAGAVAGPNLAPGAVTGDKIANGAVTGDKVNTATLGTVPSSATTNVVKGANGTLAVGQSATVFQYGPFAISARCEEYEPGRIGELFLISSSVGGSVFASWRDGSSTLGPATPEEKRELNDIGWASSEAGEFEFEGPSDTNVSASAPTGQAFNAFIGEATEKDSNTCWYWLTANVIS